MGNNALLRHLLSRIARGLPLVAGPLVLVSSLGSCTTPCGGVVTLYRTTTHPWTPAIGDRVGTPEDFHPEQCADLCASLDGITSDGGVGADLPGIVVTDELVTFCGFVNTGELVCHYRSVQPCIGGRAPTGLVQPSSALVAARRGIGTLLAEAEHLERASVAAFDELAIELEQQRAPKALITAARRSAIDERAHAAAIGRLRVRAGGSALPVERVSLGERDLRAIAEDNAIEGCVRETHGALVAALQSQAALDPMVRATYARIARDEARHALLSFAMNDWMLPRLPVRARRDIEARRREARARFEISLTAETPRIAQLALGLPDATRSRDLLSLTG